LNKLKKKLHKLLPKPKKIIKNYKKFFCHKKNYLVLSIPHGQNWQKHKKHTLKIIKIKNTSLPQLAEK